MSARGLGQCAACLRPTKRVRWLILITRGCHRCASIAWHRERINLELADDPRWTVTAPSSRKRHAPPQRGSRDHPLNAALYSIYTEPIDAMAERCAREYA